MSTNSVNTDTVEPPSFGATQVSNYNQIRAVRIGESENVTSPYYLIASFTPSIIAFIVISFVMNVSSYSLMDVVSATNYAIDILVCHND